METKKLFIIWHGALYPSYRKPFWLLQQKYGWDVHLLVPSSWNQCLPRKTSFSPDSAEPIHIYRHHPILNFHGALHFHPFFPHLFSQIKPDLVFVVEEPFSVMGWLATFWCRRSFPNVPVILYTYQNIYKKYPPPFCFMENYVLREVDRILTSDSQSGQVITRKGYDKQWDTMPLGVDLDHFNYRTPHSGSALFTVGYVGRLADEKGIDTLLWALEGLEDTIRLRIVGDGPARYRLELMARELGVHNRVAFLGPVANEELPAIYHEFDALVLPSKTTKWWKEQFGRVLAEAMACGLPVIGSDSGAIPEVIGDAGLIFPEDKPFQLANRISLLYHDSQLRNSLSLKGRVRAEQHFSAERVAKKLNEHFLEVVDRCMSP